MKNPLWAIHCESFKICHSFFTMTLAEEICCLISLVKSLSSEKFRNVPGHPASNSEVGIGTQVCLIPKALSYLVQDLS